MRKIEKKRLVFVLLDERYRALGESLCQEIGIGIHFDDGFVFQQRQRRKLVVILSRMEWVNVMTEGKTKELVESLSRRQKFWLIPQMPFAEHASLVARGLQHFGDRHFIRVQSFSVCSKQHAEIGPRRHADSLGITTGHQSRSRRCANRCGHIKICQLRSLGRHLIDARRVHMVAAEATQIAIALIVGEDDNKIGFFDSLERRRDSETNESGQY